MVTFRSKIALVMMFFCSVVPNVVQAVAFSLLHVHSRLGELLSAETLIQFGEKEEPERFTVRAASSDVYASAHLEFSDVLLGIRYQLEKKDARDYVLHITSQQPMDDPLLTTLVEFIWNGGKLLREITFTLDPADYSTGDIHSPAVEARSALSVSPLSGLNLGNHPVATMPHRDFNSIFDNGMINVAPFADKSFVLSSAVTPAVIPPPPHVLSFSMDSINVPMPTDQHIPVAASAQPIALQFEDNQGRPLLATSVIHSTAQQSGHVQERSSAQEIFDIQSPKTSPVSVINLESVKHSIHVVKDNESIYSVARRYQYVGMSIVQMVNALRKANPHLLPKKIMLESGDVIIIPTRKDVQGLELKASVARTHIAARPHYIDGFSPHKKAHFLTKNEVRVQRATVSHDNAIPSVEDIVADRRVQKNAYAVQEKLDRKIRELEARVDQETVGQAVSPTPKIASVPVLPQAAVPTPPHIGTVTSTASLDFAYNLISRYGVFCGGLLAAVIALMMWNNRHRFFAVRQRLDIPLQKKETILTPSFSSSNVLADRVIPVPTPGITMSEIITEDVASLAPASAIRSPSFTTPQKKKDHQQPNHADCIAEAEVYVAYGRLQQAEDLLVDALQKDPSSSQLSMKLLDVLQQQKKVTPFNKLAATFRQTDQGKDPVHWGYVVQMGLTLDPQNKLYQSVAVEEEFHELPPLELSVDDHSVQ